MPNYGDTTTIAQMLEPSTVSGFSAELTARIDAMREVVSRLIDQETGRTFGSVGPVSQRVIRQDRASDRLILPVPARSITGIVYSMDNSGGIYSGGTVLDPTAWDVVMRDQEGSAVTLRWSWWVNHGNIGITGTWADESTTTDIPQAIDWATNYLVMRSIQNEATSIAGVTNELGTVSPPLDPWRNANIMAVMDMYRLVTQRVIV